MRTCSVEQREETAAAGISWNESSISFEDNRINWMVRQMKPMVPQSRESKDVI